MSRRLFDDHSDSFEYRLFRLTLRISSAAAVISFSYGLSIMRSCFFCWNWGCYRNSCVFQTKVGQ